MLNQPAITTPDVTEDDFCLGRVAHDGQTFYVAHISRTGASEILLLASLDLSVVFWAQEADCEWEECYTGGWTQTFGEILSDPA